MRRHRARRLLSLALLAALALYSMPAVPATIEVNESCTLIDAIHAANNDDDSGGFCPPGGSGPDTLTLSGSVTLTEVDNGAATDANGLPVVSSDITVEGNGFVIERDVGAAAFRIFTVASNASLTLSDVTVRHGAVASHFGGGILGLANARIHVDRATVSNNEALRGGGIHLSYGVMTVARSTIWSNAAHDDGGGVWSSFSTIDVSDSVIGDNLAGINGGGMDLFGSVTTLRYTTVPGNYARRSGGGIHDRQNGVTTVEKSTFFRNAAGYGAGIASFNSNLIVTSSTLSGNSAAFSGGGVLSYGEATITNTTLSGNTSGSYGGGIENYGVTTIANSTLTGNSSYYGGGIDNYYPGRLTLVASIVAGNSGSDCYAYPPIVDGGANFDGDGSCPNALLAIPGTDLDVALADNGGPTLTHALLPGSVAADAAGDCGRVTDQRGFLRDPACDSGSFELDGTPPSCGDNIVNRFDEECDGADDARCPGECDPDCLCVPPAGACCTDGPSVESECIGTDEADCEDGGGLFLGPGTMCRADIDCSALLVTMAEMSAVVVRGGVVVRWTTAAEVDTVGFRVLRQAPGGRRKALQPVGPIVPARGTEVDGGTYEILDDSRAAANAVHYFIEDIDLFGRITRHGPIAVERGGRR